MTFYSIFSSKKEKPENMQKEKEKIKIITDNREKNSLVISELIKQDAIVELKQLEIADYLVNDIAIERKTFSDLQSSIINKRIITQLQNLKQYPKSLLIIEGDSTLFLHENAVRGFLLSVVLEFKIPIIFTKNESDTAKYLLVLAKKTPKKEISLRQSITFKSKEEQLQYILEGFPGIGPVTSKALLKKFKSIKSIINAPESELQEILGKKTSDFLKLIN